MIKQLSIVSRVCHMALCASYCLLPACSSIQLSQLGGADHSPLPPDNTIPFEPINAYFDQDTLYLKYMEAGELLYAAAPLNRSAIEQSLQPAADFNLQKKRGWRRQTEQAQSVTILSQRRWHRFREKLLQPILPSTQTRAMKISSTEETLYLYRRMQEKPAVSTQQPTGIDAAINYSAVDFNRHVLHVLQLFLREHHIQARHVLFDTGYGQDLSTQYLYADLDEQQLHIFNLEAALHNVDAALIRRSLLSDSGLTAGQAIKSFYTDFIFRPVSSLQRLFFLLTDTGLDTLTRTSLSTVGFPSLQSQPVPPLSYHPGMDLHAWERQLDKITGDKASRGTLAFLIDGKEFFPHFIETANEAEESILAQVYIFDTDDYAIKIADLLRKKSQQVDVKIIYDGSGSLMASWGRPASQPPKYSPPASIRQYLRHESNVKTRALATPWLAGDHTKLILVDRHSAYVGGMNIGREYRYEWHDLMMHVRGPIVNKLRREFNKAWAHYGWWGDLGYLGAWLKPVKKNHTDFGYPIRILRTLPHRSDIYNAQLAAIRNAKDYIYIHNAYFSEDLMLYELAKARRRGVDVRVILSLNSDADILNRSNILAANTLLTNGVRVYIYPGVSHIKAAIYDGWACLGSANFDHLSMRVNKELNLATSHSPAVDELKQRLFIPDFAASIELNEPLPSKWSDHILELVADQL